MSAITPASSGTLTYNTTTLNGNLLTSFTAGSGTIQFTSDVTIYSYLVVSGGNGGTNGVSNTNSSGQGGAGGSVVTNYTQYNIPANTSFTITVGGGGSSNGGRGSNSSLSSTIISSTATANSTSIGNSDIGPDGTQWSINNTYYGGGGGSGTYGSTGFAGGTIGGGGAGAYKTTRTGTTLTAAVAGATNSGGGGGGGACLSGGASRAGLAGGSGIIIMCYKINTIINPWSIPATIYGIGSITLTAPSSNSTGGFNYTSGNLTVASTSGSTVTILQAGSSVITATQPAIDGYTDANTTATLTVNQKAPTIGILTIPQKTFGAASFTLTDPSSDSSASFTYTSFDTTVATISGASSNIVTILKAGSTTITANQTATTNYTSGYTTATLTVNQKAPTIGTFTIPQKTVGDASFTLTNPTSDSSGVFTYTSSTPSVASISGASSNIVSVAAAGSTIITATQAQTTNYTSGSTTATLTVNQYANINGGLSTNNNIYIKQLTNNNIYWSTTNDASDNITNGTWTQINPISAWQIILNNTNATLNETNRLVITFLTNITITNANNYFVVNTNYITIDGNNKTVTISGVTNYPGLIKNGISGVPGTNGKSNITVQNINITTSNGASLIGGGGWICQSYFCTSSSGTNLITNCTNSGNITNNYSGGIVGDAFASYSSGTNTISNCANSGTISSLGGGGIAASAFAYSSTGYSSIINCKNSGQISGNYAGGIAGVGFSNQLAGNTSSRTTSISNCLNNGPISGNYAGGIVGDSFGLNNVSSTINNIINCINIGTVAGTNSGGIAGTAFNTPSSAKSMISNCYTLYGIVSYNISSSLVTNTYTANGTWSITTALQYILILDASGNSTWAYQRDISGNNQTNSYFLLYSLNPNNTPVTLITPTITNFIIPTKTYGDASFTITDPSSNSSGRFRYDSSNISVAEISGNRIIVKNAGPSNITVRQDACGNYTDGSNNATFTVNKATTVIPSFTLPTKTYGTDFSFTIQDPSSNSTGAFSYTSSDGTVATINNKTVTILRAGSTNVIATQIDPSGNYTDGSKNTIFTVNKAIPTITNFPDLSTNYLYNGSFILTDPSSNSTGAFTYTSSDTSVATISNKTVSILKAGTTTITAIDASDTNYLQGSKTATLTINKSLPTITNFPDLSTNYLYNGSFILTDPSSNSTGAFTYTSSDTSVATISNKTVSILKAGTTTITATQATDTNYLQGSVTASLTINKATPIIGALSIPTQTYSQGGTYIITAPSTNSTGAFTYTSSNASIATISGNIITILQATTTPITITATQATDTNYLQGSVSGSLTINKATPTIGALSIPTQTYSPSGTYTITDPSSNSTGAFTYTSSNISIATISGSTVTILQATTTPITITATQAADTNYLQGSVSGSLTINKAIPSITNFIIPPKTILDSSFTIIDPSSNSTGTFHYDSSNTSVATITGKIITIRGLGTSIITVRQDASGNYLDGSANLTFTVTKATPSITNFTIPSFTVLDTNATFPITDPSSNSSGTFSYTSSNTNVATINGKIITIIGVGTTVITATQTETNVYTQGTLPLTYIVNKLAPAITNFTIPTKTYGDASFTITDPSSNSPGTFSYASSNTSVATINGKIITIIGAGITTITATQAVTGDYNQGVVSITFTVNKATTILGNFTIPTKTYRDPSFTITDPSSNSPGTFSYTSSDTNVVTINGKIITITGAGSATIIARQLETTNYTDSSRNATFIVNKATPSIYNFTIPDKSLQELSFVLLDPSSNSSGGFTYTSSDTSIATISIKTLTMLRLGTTIITATQLATPNYTDSSASIIFIVQNQRPSFGSFTIPPKTYGDPPFTIADPSSNSSGAFTYTSSNTNVATIQGKIITIRGSGVSIITAIQAATSNYREANITAQLIVNKNTPTITNFTVPSKLYTTTPITIVDPISNSSGIFRYTSSNTNVASIDNKTLIIHGIGSTTIYAIQSETQNYYDASISTIFTVNKALPTFGIFTIPSKTYSDPPFTITNPSSNSPGAFSYTSSNNQVATINGNTINIIGKGTSTITVLQAATTNYTRGISTGIFSVNNATYVDTSYSSTDTNIDVSQCGVLEQLRRRRSSLVSTDTPVRFDNLASSPYPTYTQYELDMRRKAEILQYKANNTNTMQNNPTRAQLYSQMVNGYYQPTNQTPSCPENMIPKPTYYSDVPGPIQNLYLNPEIPLYNLQVTRDYTDLFYSNNDKWSYTSYTSVISNSSSDVLIGSLTIKNGIDDTAYSFSLRIPINIYVAGTNNINLDKTLDFTRKTSNITISNVSCNVYYNNTLLNSTSVAKPVNPTSDSSDIHSIKLNTRTSGDKPFESNVFSGYITFNNINLYTVNGYTYDFKININSILNTNDPNYTQSDYYSTIQNYVVINSANTNIVSNCDVTTDNLFTEKTVTITGRNTKNKTYSSSIVLA